jgi:hypothetical protein
MKDTRVDSVASRFFIEFFFPLKLEILMEWLVNQRSRSHFTFGKCFADVVDFTWNVLSHF